MIARLRGRVCCRVLCGGGGTEIKKYSIRENGWSVLPAPALVNRWSGRFSSSKGQPSTINHTDINYSKIMVKKKFYAVAKGHKPGIYSSWPECQKQVKGFHGASFKSFLTLDEAKTFVPVPLGFFPSSSTSSSPASIDNSNNRNESKTGKKFYAVAAGHKPGVYLTWSECQAQTSGASRALFKSFPTRKEAEEFVSRNSSVKRAIDAVPVDVHKKRAKISPADILMTLHFDGGARGNGHTKQPISGAGAILKIVQTDVKEETQINMRHYLPNGVIPGCVMTNNYAEYMGLVIGLRHIKIILGELTEKSAGKDIRINIFGDSFVVINQLNDSMSCNSKNILHLYNEAKELTREIRSLAGVGDDAIHFEHVYRKDNKEADASANEAMDEKRTWVTHSSSKVDETINADPPTANLNSVDV